MDHLAIQSLLIRWASTVALLSVFFPWQTILASPADAERRQGAAQPAFSSGQEMPAWVQRGSYHESGVGDYVLVATIEPAMTPTEADRMVESLVREAVQVKLLKQFGEFDPRLVSELKLTDEQVRSKIVEGHRIVRRLDQAESQALAARLGEPMGVFYRAYALIVISNSFLAESGTKLRHLRTRRRLAAAGFGAAGVLGLLGIVFCYLRIDHATRGVFTRRLQTLAVLLTLLFFVALYFAFTQSV